MKESKINPRGSSKCTNVSCSGNKFRSKLSNCELQRKYNNIKMILIAPRVTDGDKVLPLGPHHHFHLFHLVGQADPKTQGRNMKTISGLSGMMRYKSI